MRNGISFKTICKQLSYIFTKKQKISILLLVMFMIVCALFETATTAMMLPFANSLMGDAESSINVITKKVIVSIFGENLAVNTTSIIAFTLAVMYAIKAGMKLLNVRLINNFIVMNQAQMSSKLFNCYMHKSYTYHTKQNSAYILRAVTNDVPSMYTMVYKAMSMFSELLVACVMLTLLTVLNPLLMIFLAVVLSVCFLVVNIIILPITKQQGDVSRHHNVMMLKSVNQATGGLKSIMVNNRQEKFVKAFSDEATCYAKATARFNWLNNVPSIVVEVGCMISVLVFMGISTMGSENMSELLPQLATVAIGAIRLMPLMNGVNTSLSLILFHYPSLESVYNVLSESKADITKDIVFSEHTSHGVCEAIKEGINLNNITFAFSDNDRPLFENVSVMLPAKKSTAFVGVTGAGKTTLADIILGLQKPSAGSITVDGVDIEKEPEWWANRVGYIPQHIYIMDDTIRANVAFGYAQNEIDDELIWKCLCEAQIEDYIRDLPEGLNTVCGEAGVRFSGGQLQRIGIARALYGNPQFLVMDEATSALDNDTERAIIDAIDHLSGSKTMLIIAHRLSTIRSCDVVYRIMPGGNVEREKKTGEQISREGE